jgi:tRNA threonylcarbamoyladenosine biosynthesis protein TsaE
MGPVRDVVQVATADEMRELGRRLAGLLRAGDLVILSGPLGAGKTTLVQGIGAGLNIRGPVTSPTFVIARIHPPLGSADAGRPSPALVHADAYRLGGVTEVDDLDLDADTSSSVTVVEWGEGLAEGLSEDRLEISIEIAASVAGRSPVAGGSSEAESDAGLVAGVSAVADGDPDAADVMRTVRLSGVGVRWGDVRLPS